MEPSVCCCHAVCEEAATKCIDGLLYCSFHGAEMNRLIAESMEYNRRAYAAACSLGSVASFGVAAMADTLDTEMF